MLVGQARVHSYTIHVGISAIRAKLPFLSKQISPSRYDRVEIGTHSQADTQSGIYKPDPDQMRMLGSISYTRVMPDSRLQAELLPPSEQSSYTEEAALINQYAKRSRIDGHFDGDTFVRASSEPVRLILKDSITDADLQKFNSELAEKGLGEEVDWRGVKNDLVQIGVGFDNIERFEQKSDCLASRYAVLKDRIQNQFTGDKQETELQKPEQIYAEAKEEMANSYADAGVCAKSLYGQLQNPAWNINDSDTALGRYLASQYGTLTEAARKAGISEKLSNILTSAFDPFVDRLMDSLDVLIDRNRGWVASNPWMSGTIRTDYIDRERVHKAFQNAVSNA